jgi:hypothetical protein
MTGKMMFLNVGLLLIIRQIYVPGPQNFSLADLRIFNRNPFFLLIQT